jgi:RNA 3'-terminal phosphate cyclase (ATP)
MLELDGSDGGGQLLRSALTLSALSGRAFELSNVRGSRPNPGLRPQHLTAVDVAASACDAEVEGASVGSETVRFEPGPLRGGEVTADVGTAGSVTLVLDTVLPLCTALDAPLTVTVTGGTDVKWSPTTAFYRHVKLPLLRRHGVQAALDVGRAGYYPAGGGRVRLALAPSEPDPVRMTERGARQGVRVHSSASFSLQDRRVAERQADAVVEAVADADPELLERTVTYRETTSPGSALALQVEYANATAGFDAVGERGTSSEDVAEQAVEAFEAFEQREAAVDEHLADQLLLFLATVGGRIAIPEVTQHVATSLDLLAAFDYEVVVQEDDPPVLVGKPD